MVRVIERGDEEWEGLYRVWEAGGRPGWVVMGNGATYQVLMPSEGEVKFALKGAFDELYASSSAKGVARG